MKLGTQGPTTEMDIITRRRVLTSFLKVGTTKPQMRAMVQARMLSREKISSAKCVPQQLFVDK